MWSAQEALGAAVCAFSLTTGNLGEVIGALLESGSGDSSFVQEWGICVPTRLACKQE